LHPRPGALGADAPYLDVHGEKSLLFILEFFADCASVIPMRRFHGWAVASLLAVGLTVRAGEFPDTWTWDKDPKVRPEEPYKIRRTLEQTKLQVDPKELFA